MAKKKKNKLSAVQRLDKQIAYLGNAPFKATTFLSVRLVTTILLVVALYYFTNLSYFVIPFIALAYYYLIYYFAILRPVNKRSARLESDALEFFEILTLSLESGRNLEKSIEITTENVSSELSMEFAKAIKEVKYGKSLVEALRAMKKRIPSESINNILLSIMETSQFGGSILENITSQIDYLRDKRMLSIRERMNQIPNKISIISVLFMVPLMLLLVLGPLLVQYIG